MSPDWYIEFDNSPVREETAPYDWTHVAAAADQVQQTAAAVRAAWEGLTQAVLAALKDGQPPGEVGNRAGLDQDMMQRIIKTGKPN